MTQLTKRAAVFGGIALMASCAAPVPTPGVPPPIGAGSAGGLLNLGPSIQSRLLEAHNRERAAVGSAPLRLDPQLHEAAAAYARQLAATGRFQHAPAVSLQGQGENIWMGTRGAFTPERMVADWASGRRLFVPGIFPNVSRTGNWPDVAHYTQIIWPQTHSVGCAISSSATHDYLVCRYMLPGNVAGVKVP